MKLNYVRHRTSAFAVGVLAAAAAVSASAGPPTISPLSRISLQTDTAPIEVFVQLDTPSVAELNINTLQATGALAAPEAQRNQAAQVDAQQSVFRQSCVRGRHGARSVAGGREWSAVANQRQPT